MEDFVSVIIPVFNAENTLSRCLESLIKNDYSSFEIVLIDDGSTDQSIQVIEKYSIKYENIKLIKNEVNKGVAFTRNVGLKESSGNYIMFVDADDYVKDDFIKKMMSKVSLDVMPVCGYIMDDTKYNNVANAILYSKDEGLMDLKENVLTLWDDNLLQQLWNKVFVKKVIVDNELLFDESVTIGEDLQFILKYIKALSLKQFYVINECLYVYMRDQSSSIMMNMSNKDIGNHLRCAEEVYKLTGLNEQTIKKELSERKELIINNSVYLIMHNINMTFREKRKCILEIDSPKIKKLYKHHLILFFKEKIAKLIKR